MRYKFFIYEMTKILHLPLGSKENLIPSEAFVAGERESFSKEKRFSQKICVVVKFRRASKKCLTSSFLSKPVMVI